ncbi:MAG: biotin/lipoyl-binding protein [Bacteroidota bacterium]|nr:biotin/lipoyl-binding protein [Bacteroidota bacterium]MDX5427922.1 biotin/lipoyl-binding protein [Bacteroidota bacterium]MDX5447680.1 biotin/lipoyl-binding protein [Bacteroidota bacterium]MDX5505779.1 biotin/lipoyl-binding protein [Bacteroidota bacterium]
MLNISENSVREKIDLKRYRSFSMLDSKKFVRYFTYWLYALMILMLVILFLPWTQNVQGEGQITTLRPENRPQTLQSPIPGRIAEWYVREGDTVNQGDTIVFIAEIKDEYFDPNVIQRITDELDAKESAIVAYDEKIGAQRRQLEALKQNQVLKLRQARLKLQADSADMVAARIQWKLSERQFQRADTLYNEGIESRYEWEKRQQKMQESYAKFVSAQNKYYNSITELNSISTDYAEKIAKNESEIFTATSDLNAARAEVAKLRNKLANVEVRRGYYYVTAPQRSMIARTLKSGIGENIKEGEPIAEILPLQYQIAAEIFVQPMDLPLIHLGERARLEFDGWPSIVFSGWPNTSFGTFGARVMAIDNTLSPEGGYRILLAPDENDRDWPDALRFGSGVRGILLLKDVPVWYEIWRQLNGFPPEYYQPSKKSPEKGEKE